MYQFGCCCKAEHIEQLASIGYDYAELSAAEIASPWAVPESDHNCWILDSAPEITTVSNPNRKPASADVTAKKKKSIVHIKILISVWMSVLIMS